MNAARNEDEISTTAQPFGFSWVDRPLLAAMAQPEALEEFQWLRRQGIEVVLCLTEKQPRRDWVNEAGLMVVHVPVEDMEAPTQEQLDRCVSAIKRAHEHKMPVAVHCTAGLGRTGVILACYFIGSGLAAKNAVAKVRRLRPGSIETEEQLDAVMEFGRRRETV